jgi:streptogramin lyase
MPRGTSHRRTTLRLAVEELEQRLCLTGNLLVESFNNNLVLQYDGVTGAFLSTFASGGGLAGPSGITIGPDNNVYVSGRDSNDVLRFDGNTGALLGTFVAPGDGGLNGPHGIEFDPQGNLVVNSGFNGKILKYNGTTGAFLTVLAAPGSSTLEFPHGLAVGPDGNLYVADRNRDDVLRYDGQTGQFMGEFVPVGSGGLSIPTDLLFGPDGNLYVDGYASNAVLRYNGQTGQFIDAFVAPGSGGLTGVQGLVFGPDGNLYVSSMVTDQVLEYDGHTGAFKGVFASGGGLSGPTYLVFQHTDTTTGFSSLPPSPSFPGQTVSFTATVTPVRPDAVTPTGTVTFAVDGTAQASVPLVNGQATFSTSTLAVGSHVISAAYNGDGNFNTSLSGNATQEVDRFPTTTVVSSSSDPSLVNQAVTFTAAVNSSTAGAGTPTGTVTFTVDGTMQPDVPLTNGQATFSTSTLAAGDHTVSAVYNGDDTFAGNKSADLTQTVNKLDTTTTVASSSATSKPGQAVTFTTSVNPATPGTGTPTGTVTFLIDGVEQATVSLTGGTATFTLATLTTGSHSVSVVYNGDPVFASSTSTTLTQVVQKPRGHHHHHHYLHRHEHELDHNHDDGHDDDGPGR